MYCYESFDARFSFRFFFFSFVILIMSIYLSMKWTLFQRRFYLFLYSRSHYLFNIWFLSDDDDDEEEEGKKKYLFFDWPRDVNGISKKKHSF